MTAVKRLKSQEESECNNNSITSDSWGDCNPKKMKSKESEIQQLQSTSDSGVGGWGSGWGDCSPENAAHQLLSNS